MKQGVIYSREEVLACGFEARCVGPDGARYLWHGDCGLRVESRTRRTTLISDPSLLPEGMWFPTRLGLEELAEDESDQSST